MAVATSIVDFLKGRGLKPQAGEKFPFYETRGQLFNRLGLGTDLGEFRGTAEQNTALLQNLIGAEKSTGISITPENLFDVAMVGMGGGTALPGKIGETPLDTGGMTGGGVGGTTSRGGTTLDKTTGGGDTKNIWGPATAGARQTDPKTGQEYEYIITPDQPLGAWSQVGFEEGFTSTGGGEVSGGTALDITEGALGGGDASSLLPQIPGAEDVASQALEQVQKGATFPLQVEAAEAQREVIRLSSQRQKESFIQQIASRGLFFSGAKTKGLKTVEADQLSQILGVDRSFALLIAQGLETAAQDIVKEAQKGRTEAIQSLEALGYAINPLTGKVEPTLQAQQAQAQEQRLAAGQEEQVRQFEVTQERLAAQQELNIAKEEFDQAISIDQRRIAQATLEQAERRLQLAEQSAIGIPLTPEEEVLEKLDANQQKTLGSLDSAASIANKIESMIQAIDPINFGPLARVAGFFQRGLAGAGLDPAAKTFLDYRQSVIAPLARAISGEVGVLTDNDIARAEGLLPNIGESQAEVDRKIINLKESIINKRVSIYKSAGIPITADLFEL